MYFVRINSSNINPLIKESLNVNKTMHDEGKYSWYTCVNNMFKEFELDIEDYSNIDKLSYLTESSKLFLYSKLKNDIILEPYLLQLSNFTNRQLIAKCRSSDLNLEIEKGRYKNIPRQQRLQYLQNIEDEDHFFLHCRINNQPRNLLFNIIGNYYSNFINMSDLNKLKYILNPNPDLSSDMCTFIKQSLELR